jgi:hypothetical protein
MRWIVSTAAVVSVSAAAISISEAPSGASVPHSGCAPVSAGNTSGLCGLYPGNASSNTKELGSVAVSSDGLSITVQTQDASTAAAPETSFACLVSTPASEITKRLQDEHCTGAGGVWLPFIGGSLTVDLSQYPQFLNTELTIQVAANRSADNPNGDSFYNNFSVSTVVSGPAA